MKSMVSTSPEFFNRPVASSGKYDSFASSRFVKIAIGQGKKTQPVLRVADSPIALDMFNRLDHRRSSCSSIRFFIWAIVVA
jgi:hypothetical protein